MPLARLLHRNGGDKAIGQFGGLSVGLPRAERGLERVPDYKTSLRLRKMMPGLRAPREKKSPPSPKHVQGFGAEVRQGVLAMVAVLRWDASDVPG